MTALDRSPDPYCTIEMVGNISGIENLSNFGRR